MNPCPAPRQADVDCFLSMSAGARGFVLVLIFAILDDHGNSSKPTSRKPGVAFLRVSPKHSAASASAASQDDAILVIRAFVHGEGDQRLGEHWCKSPSHRIRGSRR